MFICFLLLVTFSVRSYAQAFLNGSFETNTAAACDYNMSNATFTTKMANATAYGLGGELDIMQSTCPYGPSQSGTWFAALACPSGNTDAFTMRLSAPLVMGVTYTLSFWDKGDIGCCPPGMPVIIGVSTVAGAAGTVVYTGPTPTTGTWIQRCFSFVAPNNGQHISVSTAGATRWTHVDNFVLNGTCTVLPIELVFFKATCRDNTIILNWRTATEKNNKYFAVEYSEDGTNFEEIGRLNGAGNSNTMLNYEFEDARLKNSIGYYRIKQTDLDGSGTYSEIISSELCHSKTTIKFDAFPTPLTDKLYISVNRIGAKYKVLNALGEQVFIGETKAFETIIDVSGLVPGVYFVQLTSDEEVFTKKLIKN